MKKNKRVVIIILIVLLTILNVFLVFKKDTSVVEKSKVIKVERKEFNIYKEQNTGKKDYVSVSDTTFPTSGYLLNTTKTMCYGYNGNKLNSNPVVQELTNDVINGSITINSNNTIYCDLYFDKNETPTISKFDVTGKTSGGTTLSNSFTYQTDNLPFTVTYTDNENDVKQYCINETNNIANCNWQTLSGTSGTYTLTNKNDGTKTMYIFLKDKANNISPSSNKSITVDKTAPVVKSFTLTGTNDTGQTLSNSAIYTHTKKITYSASITETNIEGHCIYEGNNCSYNSNTSTTITNQSYTLTNETEGQHTINIKVKDKAGNESVIDTNSTKKITLDKTNPTAAIRSVSQDTSSITVTVGYDGKDSIIARQCRVSSGSWVTASSSGSCTISNLSDGTPYTIEVRVRDASGRYSTNNPSVSITTERAGFSGTGKQLIDYNPKGLSETEIGGMRRFVGKCNGRVYCDGIVDNVVCFGYADESMCNKINEDYLYMYRIIGITSNGSMKLVKLEPLKNNTLNTPRFQWWNNTDQDIKWPESLIYNAINGNNFLTSLSMEWQMKISPVSWLYGDIGDDGTKAVYNASADEIYAIETGKASSWSGDGHPWGNEVERWTDRIEARVGLLYLSDYYYSYDGEGSSNCYTEKDDCGKSWIRFGTPSGGQNLEWVIPRFGRGMYGHFYSLRVSDSAQVGWMGLSEDASVRPVFYLDPDVLISSGNGSYNNPFIIAK